MSDGVDSDQQAEQARRLTDVGIHDIGQRLIDLGEQLIAIGKHGDSDKLREHMREAEEIAVDEVWEEVDREMKTAVRRTLSGLGSFRKEYNDWERLAVEYALARRGFTQREVANLLGVGLSTINRWAQHPLADGD
jgi:DNA-binding NtrC family response regulator